MTVGDLKKYIYEKDKISFILNKLGCHSIRYHQKKNYYSCANPDGDNETAVIIYNNEYLNCINYTRNIKVIDSKPDIITLIRFYRKEDFRETIKYLHNILGLKISYTKIPQTIKTKEDPLEIFKKVKKHRVIENEYDVLDEKKLVDFYPFVHIDFAKDGILKSTIEKFQLGYSYHQQRTIIPIRYWLTGELIGIIGRTSIEYYDSFNIPKYLAIEPYLKTFNLYGLWENFQTISEKKYCVVFEAQKSVLQRDTLKDNTAVAVCGHDISDEQVRILIGLNLEEIVIAFDKDVSLFEIRQQCEKFYGIRTVSYIYDKENLLKPKESPADTSNDNYRILFANRTKYTENEHREYKKELIESMMKG